MTLSTTKALFVPGVVQRLGGRTLSTFFFFSLRDFEREESASTNPVCRNRAEHCSHIANHTHWVQLPQPRVTVNCPVSALAPHVHARDRRKRWYMVAEESAAIHSFFASLSAHTHRREENKYKGDTSPRSQPNDRFVSSHEKLSAIPSPRLLPEVS